ncbi:hypothetical protein [Tsukamurella sp. 1534]|uniref:hypothetical protein n=1 Tax=Tsukamurella sp. 1534 TaxID=1151061 RepID=UPI0002FB5B05|nr:hypothetical protein [Tsukamurella sp. 1534]
MDQLKDRPTTSAAARRRVGRTVAGALAAGALLLGGAACGPSDDGADPGPTVTLPASFPKADVPLVDGTLIDAGERDQDGVKVYNVTVQAAPGGFDEAKKKLADAGFQALGAGPEGSSTSAQYSGKGYVITVSSVTDAAIPNSVFYSISKA